MRTDSPFACLSLLAFLGKKRKDLISKLFIPWKNDVINEGDQELDILRSLLVQEALVEIFEAMEVESWIIVFGGKLPSWWSEVKVIHVRWLILLLCLEIF